MTRRATARGAARAPLDGLTADVVVCGASFAGLAVARELAGAGADVLVVDRYEIGERATSACAAPLPWLEAMRVARSVRQELPYMTLATPHGTARVRLPWRWGAFDYRDLCAALWGQTGTARFETAKVDARTPDGVRTDRGELRAPLVVDALGWRRVLGEDGYQPPDAPLSRGLELHAERATTAGDALDCWIERGLVRQGYGWRVPAGGEARIGVGSYDPRQHVRRGTDDLAGRLREAGPHYQGNWFPHRLRAAADDRTFFAGDSAGHCIPLSGEGIRPAFYFGIACGRELRAVLEGRRTREAALRRYAAFSEAHRRPYEVALGVQRLVPRVPPRVLTAALRVLAVQPVADRAFGFYLSRTDPAFAAGSTGVPRADGAVAAAAA